MKTLYNAIRIFFISRKLIRMLKQRFPEANYTIWVNHWMDKTFQVRLVSGYEDEKNGSMLREYKWYNGNITYAEKLVDTQMDWLRKQFGLHITLHPVKDDDGFTAWNITISDLADYKDHHHGACFVVIAHSRQYYLKYEEAMTQAVGMALGILKEREITFNK